MELNVITNITIPKDKDSICRFCLKLSDDLIQINNNSQKIAWPKAGNLTIEEVFSKLCLKIDPADFLPNRICNQCKNCLEDCFVFVTKIQDNEEILRRVYSEDELSDSESSDDTDLSYEVYGEFLSLEDDEIGPENIIKYEHAYGQKVSQNSKSGESDKDEFSNEGCQDSIFMDDESKSTSKISEEEKDESSSNHIDESSNIIFTKEPGKIKVEESDANLSWERKTIVKRGDEPYYIKQCFFCDRKFSNEDLRTLHFFEHVMQATEDLVPHRPICTYCGLLTERDQLEDHILTKHQNEEDLNCDQCNIRFSDVQEVKKHLENDHIETFEEEIASDIKCMICNKIFSDIDEVMEHSLEHTYRRHTCLSCKDVFICGAALNEHHKTHPQYKHKCTICKKLVCRATIKSHSATHKIRERNLECHICKKKYSSEHHFKYHVMCHSRPSNICPHCGYSTKWDKDFVTHMRTHSNERPFKCTFEDCGRAFKTNSALSSHVKEHLKIRKFSCEFCDYKTSRSVGLKIHRRIHTGEKPYNCKFCAKPFNRKWSLTMHLKKIHPE